MNFVQSPYWQSRQGKPITLVVIHTTVGTYNGTISYFQNNTAQVSAHYVVSLTGDVTQMVKEDVGANHAGRVDHPTTPQVVANPSINPNWYSVGIENADNGNPSGADRSAQYPSLAMLVRDICHRNNIPIDRDHICGHHEIYSLKTCPGNIDVDKVVQLAKGDSMDPKLSALLSKYNVQSLNDLDAKLMENVGLNWGSEAIGGGFLGDARRQVTALKAQLANQSTQPDMTKWVEMGMNITTTNGNTTTSVNYARK